MTIIAFCGALLLPFLIALLSKFRVLPGIGAQNKPGRYLVITE